MAKDTFIDYYNQELTYLRKSGAAFAQRNPKLAQRLKFDDSVSPDPHTERLIQSFAFITAKINQKIDQNFAKMGEALLEVLYPHHTKPIPAMAIVQFNPTEFSSENPVVVPKHTSLYAYSGTSEEICYFKTVYPLTLWPIDMISVGFVGTPSYHFADHTSCRKFLRFQLQSEHFKTMLLDELVFQIRGSKSKALPIYQMLFAQENSEIFIATDQHVAYRLAPDALEPVGFLQDETMLPVSAYGTHGYNLLQEFLHFPDKFLFFRIKGLDKIRSLNPGSVIDILISTPKVDLSILNNIELSDFSMQSVPVVNLFESVSDPIRVDDTQLEYFLLADQRSDISQEVYSVEEVYSAPIEGDKEIFTPFFSMQHSFDDNAVYWIAKRRPAEFRGKSGSDVYLSFVKSDYSFKTPDYEIVFAKILCTNRDLPEDIQPGTLLYLDTEELPLESVICLTHPKSYPFQEKAGESIWKLIGQLAVNHMAFADEARSLHALKEMIALHSRNPSDYQIIDTLKKIEIRDVVLRFGSEAWRGFVRGTQMRLHINSPEANANPSFLLACVVRHFMAMHVAINSFVQLCLFDADLGEEIMKWKPLPGEKLKI